MDFDPTTAKPAEAQPAFDPATAKPVTPAAPAAATFDPSTAKPIDTTPAAPGQLPDLGGTATPGRSELADRLVQAKTDLANQQAMAVERSKVRAKFLPPQDPDTGVYTFNTEDPDFSRRMTQFRAMPTGAIFWGTDSKQHVKTDDGKIADLPEDKWVFPPPSSTPGGAFAMGAGQNLAPTAAGLAAAGATNRMLSVIPGATTTVPGRLLSGVAALGAGLGVGAGTAVLQRKAEEAVAPELVEQEMRDMLQQPVAYKAGSIAANLPFFRPGFNPRAVVSGNLTPAAIGAGISGGQSILSGDPDWKQHMAENALIFGLMGKPTELGETILGAHLPAAKADLEAQLAAVRKARTEPAAPVATPLSPEAQADLAEEQRVAVANRAAEAAEASPWPAGVRKPGEAIPMPAGQPILALPEPQTFPTELEAVAKARADVEKAAMEPTSTPPTELEAVAKAKSQVEADNAAAGQVGITPDELRWRRTVESMAGGPRKDVGPAFDPTTAKPIEPAPAATGSGEPPAAESTESTPEKPAAKLGPIEENPMPKEFEGEKVRLPVQNAETGEPEEMDMPADRAHKVFVDRINILNKVIDCLGA